MDNQFLATRQNQIRLLIFLIGILCIFIIGSIIFGPKAKREDVSVPTEIVINPFDSVVVGAKSAYVYDARTKTVLFAKAENSRLPLASLTKIMSALVADDTSPSFSTVTVSADALLAEGDSGLYQGESWSLRELLGFSLVTSSNDGMRAVALSLGALSRAGATPDEIISDFVGAMNSKAGELGLKNTYFLNETGLDLSDVKGGAYGTARDMSMLLEFILLHHPELLSDTKEILTTFHSLDNISHLAKNTNGIISEIPGALISKTGFTKTAGGNLAIVFDPELGRPIIVVILGSTEHGRFNDMLVLVNTAMEYIALDQPPIKEQQ